VLLAEDFHDLQTYMEQLITVAGGTVHIVDDGEAAVAAAQTGDYDVVLMDVGMPNLGGVEATIRLRERGYLTPVIALTAHAIKEVREQTLAAGFDDYLTKPAAPSALYQIIQKWRGKVHRWDVSHLN
jgi:CheY-like chemotaxis protein